MREFRFVLSGRPGFIVRDESLTGSAIVSRWLVH